MLQEALENITKFYQNDIDKDNSLEHFAHIMKEICKMNSLGIFYISSNKLLLKFSLDGNFERSYNLKNDLVSEIYHSSSKNLCGEIRTLLKLSDLDDLLLQKLSVKGAVFGLCIAIKTNCKFTNEEKIIFNTYSAILTNIIKDLELSGILSAHLKQTTQGLKEIQSEYGIIQQQNKQIKKNEKLQNKFIANISHDLRTPLNSIICLSETLSSEIFGKLTSKQKEYIDDIRIAGIRLMGMINEVLDISKLESKTVNLNKTSLEVKLLIDEVCNILTPLSEKKHLNFEKDIPTGITVLGDYIKLQQVLFNIIGNAIKYSYTNSKIKISAYTKDRYCEIKIQDFGIGITTGNVKKIFKKFYQVQNPMSKSELSTGLGLTIAKEFIKLHKGKIEVQSEIEKGTTFIIKLPISND